MQAPTKSLILSTIVAAFAAGDAMACVQRDATATPSVVVRQLTNTTWRVLVPGYTTTTTAANAYCAVGLSVGGAVTAVDSVALLAVNAAPVAVNWSKSTPVGTAFNSVKAGTWTGFLGQAQSAIASGTKVLYDFEITVSTGTTLAQLTTALQAGDVGSDAANMSGALAGGSLQDVFRPTTVTEQALSRNARIFHNQQFSDLSTRLTADAEDRLVFMQPRDFRRGQGAASGWVVRLQDQDASTAEDIELSYHSYSSTTAITPDLSSAGLLTSVRFSVFGAGTGAMAMTYRLTTSVGAALPIYSGIGLTLPKPATDFPADGATVAMQTGGTTQVPSASRQQFTYSASGTMATAFGVAGSTMHLGGLYDCATIQAVATSKAYGPTENLFGPESLVPDTTGGDGVTFRVMSEKHKNSPVVAMIAPDYGPAIPSPFKTYLMQTFVTTAIFATGADGSGTSIAFPVPPNVTLAAQGVYFDFTSLEFEFGDATRFTSR